MKVSDVFSPRPEYDSPEWKALGRKIRQQRMNACQICHRTDKLTHVHHWVYEKGKKLSEARSQDLALLCEDCHAELHLELKRFRRDIFPRQTPRSFKLLNAALTVLLTKRDTLEVAYALCGLAASGQDLRRFIEEGTREFGN